MLPESALAEMYPVIMTPSHDGKYFHNYTLSLLNIVHTNASLGLPLQVMMQRGESLITRARNNCVAKFLENKEWTHLFWIDSDIGFSPDSFYRLLLADKDVVAGVYPLKRENWPQAGLPAGMTQADFERMYTSYTVNTNDKNENGEIVLKVDEEGELRLRQRLQPGKQRPALPLLRLHGRSRKQTLPVRRLHLLPSLATNRRRSVRRCTIQPDPPRRKSVSRLVCRILANQCCQCGLCPRRHHYAPRTGRPVARQSARPGIRLTDRQAKHFNSACLPPYNAYRFLFRRPQGRLKPSYSGETI